MAKTLENVSKDLLRAFGLPAPLGGVAGNPMEALEVAGQIGLPVVLKALVPVGKRGKAGAIKFASTPDEVRELAGQLIGMVIRGFPAESILIEPKLEIEREFYCSIAIDRNRQTPVIIFSAEGGVDIEEIHASQPDRIVQYHVDYGRGLEDFEAKQICVRAGLTGPVLRDLPALITKLYRFFVATDCDLLEINPLALTKDGKLVLVSSMMSVDSAAVFRQPELQERVEMSSERVWRPMTEREKEAVAVNEADPYRGTARYTEMDGGDIGFLCGGGGGSLLLFDSIESFGGAPANYSEVGGNPPAAKVRGVTRVILSKPGVRGLLVACNITNNTQVDQVATGVVQALEDMQVDPASFPVVVRYAGVSDERGREIFEAAGIEYHGDDITMSTAARMMVEKMQKLDQGAG